MSIDTVSSRADTPPAPLALAAPPLADPPAPDLPQPALPPAAAASLRLQARRLRAVHELAGRIDQIEHELVGQAQALERSRLQTRDTLRELQQRSASLTTELLRSQARGLRQSREQDDKRLRLESRIGIQLREMEAALPTLQQALQAHAGVLADLQDRQATLERLHTHLDRLLHRNGREQELLTAEFQQQLELLRVTQSTLQDWLDAQQTSLLALTLEHDQVRLDIDRLQSTHADFVSRTRHRLQRLARQQRLLASLLAVFALLSLALIAWCYTHPVALPPLAHQQFLQLSGITARHDDLAQIQAQVLAGHESRLAEQQAALELARDRNDRLQQATLRQERQLARLRHELAALRASVTAQASAGPPPGAPYLPPVERTAALP